MSYIGSTQISTEEYGLIEVERLHKYNLQCKALTFNSSSGIIGFAPISAITAETRNSSYVITTFKYNRITISSDQLIYTDGNWKRPDELQIGDEVWINEAKIAVTDAITSISFQHKLSRMYNVSFSDDLSHFANKILLKEGLLIEEDDTNDG